MKRTLSAAALALAALLSLSPPLLADVTSVPGESAWVTARFPAGATTVTVDVYDLTAGAQVGTALSATRIQLNAANTDVWTLNLSTMPGFPTTCAQHSYLMRWKPDASDCVASPSLCQESVQDFGGYLCKASLREQPSFVTTTTPVSGQGISQAVIDYFNRRGQQALRWERIDRSATGSFGAPADTVWRVYFYKDTGAWPRPWCVVDTTSDPAVSLPSTAACAGN